MPTQTIQKGICRFDIDDRQVHGHMVRIMRRGRMYQEFFSDKRYGGKRKSKRAAVERYEQLVEQLPKPKEQKGQMTARNQSGKVGVHLAHDIDRRWPDTEYWSYVASWLDDDGKRVNVKFSWNKYGEHTAFELAGIARDREVRDREQILKIYERRQAAKASRKRAKHKSAAKKKSRSGTRGVRVTKKSVKKKAIRKK